MRWPCVRSQGLRDGLSLLLIDCLWSGLLELIAASSLPTPALVINEKHDCQVLGSHLIKQQDFHKMSLKSIGQYGKHLRRCKYDKVRFSCTSSGHSVPLRLKGLRASWALLTIVTKSLIFLLEFRWFRYIISGKITAIGLPTQRTFSDSGAWSTWIRLRSRYLRNGFTPPVTCLQGKSALDLLRLWDPLN